MFSHCLYFKGSFGGPAKLATKLGKTNANWTASGGLEFLNSWTYKLGEEVHLYSGYRLYLLTYSLDFNTIWQAATLYVVSFSKQCPVFLQSYSDDLGVSLRIKYGFLLQVRNNVGSDTNAGIWCRILQKKTSCRSSARSLSMSEQTHNLLPSHGQWDRDRMLTSAMNFALGFFGWPLEGQYQQSITIEASGVSGLLSGP